jgi:hypothetical protein
MTAKAALFDRSERGERTTMNSNRALLAAALLGLAANASAAGEIYRCKSPAGGVSYQQQPCGDANEGGAVGIATQYPDHTVERDRLMQREAAMDARLLKRLEIDAGERIARDERIAREREVQAERERTERERVQNAPVYIIGFPQRHRQGPRRPWTGYPTAR